MFGFSFLQRRILPAFALAICFAIAFLVYGWIFVTYRFTTDIFLGQNGVGTTFEDPKVSFNRIKDSLELPPPADLNVARFSDLVLVFLVSGDRTIRIRSTVSSSNLKRIEAVHRYLADGLISSLMVPAQSSRRLLEIKIKQGEATVSQARTEEQLNAGTIVEIKRSEASLDMAKKELREDVFAARSSSPPPATSPTDVVLNNVLSQFGRSSLLSTYEKLDLLELPTMRFNTEQNLSKLRQVVTTGEAELERNRLELEMWKPPSITVLTARDIRPFGPGTILRTVLGFVCGLVFYIAALQMYTRFRPSDSRK